MIFDVGWRDVAVALAMLLLAGPSTAHASRDCLDFAQAARSWPTPTLAKDNDNGCGTYDHHPVRAEALALVEAPGSEPEMPALAPETITPPREPALTDRWNDTELLQLELHELEPVNVAPPESASEGKPFVSAVQLALFVSLVLATMSVIEVARTRHGMNARRRRWSSRQSRG
jgi:hypothetical protein